MSIEDTLKAVIVESLSVDASKVVPEATFVDLGADSLDLVELIMAIEEKCKISIPDEDAKELKTVGEALAYVKSHVAQC